MISNLMHVRSLPFVLLAGYLGVALAQDGIFVTPQGSFSFNAPNGAPQQQSQSTARRTASGTVVNSVTGEPIGRALVRVNGPESRSGFTGSDGRFEIPNVPEGNVYLTAQKPGYFDLGSLSGPQRGFPSPSAMLGPATGDMILKLAPEAKIRGRVLDKTGEPIESLSIQLLARIVVEGRKQWQVRGQATTDDAGTYLLDDLLPGEYAIHTLSLGSDGASDLPANSESSEVFPPTYYPSAPDRSSVQPLELKPGQELAIDLNLSPVAGFGVSGVVVGGRPPLSVMCEDADGQPLSYSVGGVDFRTGKFRLSGIPPGSWTLHASTQSGQEGAAEAEQAIEVSSSDIKGLVLQLQPLPSIDVHVERESRTQGPPPVVVSLASVDGNQMRNRFASQAPGGVPGSLSVQGIPPGAYRVSARAANNSECIGSVMSGNSDLTREELTVSAGSQASPIEVTLRNDCASISGIVHSSAEQPGMSSVVVLSDSPLKPPGTFVTGNDGKFFIPNLTPGEYRLFAFTDISDLEYANPEALRDFTGQDITVGPNEKANVQLDLITRGN